MRCLDIKLEIGGKENKAGDEATNLGERIYRSVQAACRIQNKGGRRERLPETNYPLEDTNKIFLGVDKSTGLNAC